MMNGAVIDPVLAAFQTRQEWQPLVNHFIYVDDLPVDTDAGRSSGTFTPDLLGVPIAVKDNIDVAGMPATSGSDFFRDHVPTVDAFCVQRLRAHGAVVVGKTNLHEFAYGATNDNPFYGRCRNPWLLEAIPGGSSGGSGVAVATDSCRVALGSDTGGSGRIPAAFCGVTGLRPTFGVISTTGVFPLAPSLDTVSIMAREVDDVAAAFHTMVAFDARDPRSIPHDRLTGSAPSRAVEATRVAVLDLSDYLEVDAEVAAAFENALDELRSAGVSVSERKLDGLAEAFTACDAIMKCEALSTHASRVDIEPHRFGKDTLERLLLGREVSSLQLAEAYQLQAAWARKIDLLLADSGVADCLAMPTTPVLAPLADGAETLSTTARVARLTYPWSLALTPAMSLPCGRSASGLPIGMQIVARRFGESTLFGVAELFQHRTAWHLGRPPRPVPADSPPLN